MSGDKYLIGLTPVNTNLWTQVAVTLSGTTATTYINGIVDATATVGVPTAGSVDQTIGKSYTPYYFFNGSIDDVNVYSRALSGSEIRDSHTIPEPSSLFLLGIAAVSLLAYRSQRSMSPGEHAPGVGRRIVGPPERGRPARNFPSGRYARRKVQIVTESWQRGILCRRPGGLASSSRVWRNESCTASWARNRHERHGHLRSLGQLDRLRGIRREISRHTNPQHHCQAFPCIS